MSPPRRRRSAGVGGSASVCRGVETRTAPAKRRVPQEGGYFRRALTGGPRSPTVERPKRLVGRKCVQSGQLPWTGASGDQRTGLPSGELLGLRWGDLDFTKREMRVERALHYDETLSFGARYVIGPVKGGRPRTITFDQTRAALLQDWRKEVPAALAGGTGNVTLLHGPITRRSGLRTTGWGDRARSATKRSCQRLDVSCSPGCQCCRRDRPRPCRLETFYREHVEALPATHHQRHRAGGVRRVGGAPARRAPHRAPSQRRRAPGR